MHTGAVQHREQEEERNDEKIRCETGIGISLLLAKLFRLQRTEYQVNTRPIKRGENNKGPPKQTKGQTV